MAALNETGPDEWNGQDIPIFDISKPDQELADELILAAATYGFLFVKGIGLEFTAHDIDRTFGLAREFFHIGIEEKQSFSMQNTNFGWTPTGSEVLDPSTQKEGDPKEAFNIGEFIANKAQQPLPPVLQEAEAHISHFQDLCRGLCQKILRIIAVGLKIDASEGGMEWFTSRHDGSTGPSGTILRLLYYPSAARTSNLSVRAGAHSDYGSLTLLFRLPNQPGLEILTPAGNWTPVTVQPASTLGDPYPPILVNIGDLLDYWTSGLLRSTVHRVVFPASTHEKAEERYSLAFFFHPSRDTKLNAVPSKLVRNRLQEADGSADAGSGSGVLKQDRRWALTADDHLQSRLAATYQR